MCLYPILIRNPRYMPNKKNGGSPPKCSDKRKLMVPVGCGQCIECRRQKANEWKVRLREEMHAFATGARGHPASGDPAHGRGGNRQQGYFVTLTFNQESLDWFMETCHAYNEVATDAVRHFLERWRKANGKSVRHWLITELGHEGTERLHLHGIIWTTPELIKKLDERWSYGWVNIGHYCNSRTVNYIVKYVTKIDNDHPDYTPKIYCSSGLGNTYLQRGKEFNRYRGENTREYYLTPEGFKLALPMYYRNHIYNDEEKELLWLQKLDKQDRYINGVKFHTETSEEIKIYLNALKTAQRDNKKNGYGQRRWKETKYLDMLEKLKKR